MTRSRRRFLRVFSAGVAAGLTGCQWLTADRDGSDVTPRRTTSGGGQTTAPRTSRRPTGTPTAGPTDDPETATASPTESHSPTPTETRSPTPAPAASSASWPMFGFDAGNTGHRPEVTGPGSKPHYQWSLDYDQGSAFMATNAVFAAGTLVVNGPDYRIRGVDPATGTERWQWAYPAEFGNEGTPAVAAGGVFHGVDALYRLDLDTGQRQWTAEVPLFPRASPTVADGVVYVPTDGVAAVDAASGEIRWRESLGRAEGAPAVQGSSVVANVRTETGSTVTCLDAETGEERWSFARDEWFRAPPAVRGSTVYVGASDGRLSALALDTGEERWAVETGQRIWMSPAVDESRVYVGTDDGRLVTVDRDAGKRQWSRELEGAVRSTVRVGESLYAGTLGSTLSALDPDDGSTTWEYTTPHPVFNDPVVTADRVYLATEDGMFALQP